MNITIILNECNKKEKKIIDTIYEIAKQDRSSLEEAIVTCLEFANNEGITEINFEIGA